MKKPHFQRFAFGELDITQIYSGDGQNVRRPAMPVTDEHQLPLSGSRSGTPSVSSRGKSLFPCTLRRRNEKNSNFSGE
jgi:hypothetical protein